MRDVLAADEFAVGAGDPTLHLDPAHDVLAAEEFAVGSGDPALSRGPVELPGDPTGIAEPHDVLAAEEFALPAGPPARGDATAAPSRGRQTVLGAAALAAGTAAFSVLRRRRRRG